MRRLVVGVMACVACGSETPSPDAQLPDAAPFVPGPNRILIESWGSEPVYVRYRDGRGPWTTPDLVAPSTYELHVTDAYDFIAVCEDDYGSDSARLKSTFADGDAYMACFDSSFSYGPPQVPTHYAVTGDMVQPGDVFLYDWDWSSIGPWTFSLQVEPGTYDLIAVGNRHVVIRRDQMVTGTHTVERIDTVQEGVPLVVVPFSVNAEVGEQVRSHVWLDTFDGFALIEGEATSLLVPPSSILAPGDTLDAMIDTTTATTRRTLETAYKGGQPSYTLMPMLDIEIWHPDRSLFVSWTTLPPFTHAAMWVITTRAMEAVDATPRWFDVTGATGLGLGDHPGDYPERWVAHPVNTHVRRFGLYEVSEALYRTSAYEEWFGFVTRDAPETPPRLRARMRARHDVRR